MKRLILWSVAVAVLGNTVFARHTDANEILPGAYQMEEYMPLLEGRRVALLVNQTSRIGNTLLPDTLLKRGVKVVKLFVPEHGFRGTEDAGAHIKNGVDGKTGLPVISLYGNNKQPTEAQLKNVDVVVYDLQDVGVRFYTYISTLQYMMEACAAYGKELMILDRPDPNGHYVDGPVLDTNYRSFVGMQPVPVVYGMTPGEYAGMLMGEQWIKGADKLNMKVVFCRNYDHTRFYSLPVAPSPNLKTMEAVYLYPSLCFFEGTEVSVGRGTDYPFEQYGHPAFKGKTPYYFIPEGKIGASKPLLKHDTCYGEHLQLRKNDQGNISRPPSKLNVVWLVKAYQWFPAKDLFFNAFFEKLAGTAELRKQIEEGKTAEEIGLSWQPAVKDFKKIRKRYLLYKDFE